MYVIQNENNYISRNLKPFICIGTLVDVLVLNNDELVRFLISMENTRVGKGDGGLRQLVIRNKVGMSKDEKSHTLVI